ncbi:actin binding protein [Pelomyxa schiedti]|nr:actin binding protein [Pelomyxa schiedti]
MRGHHNNNTGGSSKPTGGLVVLDEPAVRSALAALSSPDDPTNWLLFTYQHQQAHATTAPSSSSPSASAAAAAAAADAPDSPSTLRGWEKEVGTGGGGGGTGGRAVAMAGRGSGGVEELCGRLADDMVGFAVILLKIGHDAYVNEKIVLVTWAGTAVPGGLVKARLGFDAPQLVEFLSKSIIVAGEAYAENYEQLSYNALALKVCSARTESGSKADKVNQPLRRSATGREGSIKKSTLVIADSCIDSVKSVFLKQQRWVLLGYSKTTKDLVEPIASGNGGIEEIIAQFTPDRVGYCIYCFKVKQPGVVELADKFAFLTLIGEEVPPLQKSRSTGHRQDLIECVEKLIPLHLIFQPSMEQMTDKILIARCS